MGVLRATAMDQLSGAKKSLKDCFPIKSPIEIKEEHLGELE